MSLTSRTRLHTVRVLRQTTSVGLKMGISRSYSVVNTAFKCTVEPQDVVASTQLGQSAETITHLVYSSAQPVWDETYLIQWGDVYMRAHPPENVHGLDRLWVTKAEALTVDQAAGVYIE